LLTIKRKDRDKNKENNLEIIILENFN